MLGVVTRLAGGGSASGTASGSVDGTGSAALFNSPCSVAVSTSGTFYVVDQGNHLIRMISPTGTITLNLSTNKLVVIVLLHPYSFQCGISLCIYRRFS